MAGLELRKILDDFWAWRMVEYPEFAYLASRKIPLISFPSLERGKKRSGPEIIYFSNAVVSKLNRISLLNRMFLFKSN
jgi:hypothetical protein